MHGIFFVCLYGRERQKLDGMNGVPHCVRIVMHVIFGQILQKSATEKDMDALHAFRARALNPEHPVLRGSAQNPDIFFQANETRNQYYDALPAVVEEYMGKVNQRLGTNYQLFKYYGATDAEPEMVAIGSVCAAEETVVE